MGGGGGGGARDFCRGGHAGERSALMCSAQLYPCCPFRKSENRNGNCEQGCEVNFMPKKLGLSG